MVASEITKKSRPLKSQHLMGAHKTLDHFCSGCISLRVLLIYREIRFDSSKSATLCCILEDHRD
jgi:hypothetical protein